ncbi:MAG: MFS transporter [Acetobacteraceae bacterium]|nr:MFS transporter [Acetobacteraceae bacterium]
MAELHPPGEQVKPPAPAIKRAGAAALVIVQAGWILAVMDYTLYFFALPLILQDLKISVPGAGFIFFLSLQGTFVGSLVVPLLADAFGRKPVLMGTVLLYAITSGVVAFAPSAAFLTLARFFVTFATGGEQPVGATYIAEVWDARTRGRALGFMQSGLALGTLLASLLLATVGASFGWRPLFLIGILPAALVLVMRFWLPESRTWADSREERHRSARASNGEARQRFSLAQLFAPDLRKLTILGTILLIAANATNGGIFAWAPTFLKQERGLDIASVGWYGIVLALGQLVGYNVCGWLADTLGRRRALALYLSLGILSVVAFGLVTNLPLLAGATFLVGFSLSGMFAGLIIFLSELFPTRARATGMGWCLGIGLFFFALVPLVIGLLAPTISFGLLFATITPAACVAGLITLLFVPETKGRELG